MKLHIRRSPGIAFCKRLITEPDMITARRHKEKAKAGTCKNCLKALAKHETKTKREWH